MPIEAFDENEEKDISVIAKETIALAFDNKGQAERLEGGVEAIQSGLAQQTKYPSTIIKIIDLASKSLERLGITSKSEPIGIEEKAWRILANPSRLKTTWWIVIFTGSHTGH